MYAARHAKIHSYFELTTLLRVTEEHKSHVIRQLRFETNTIHLPFELHEQLVKLNLKIEQLDCDLWVAEEDLRFFQRQSI